MNLSRRRFLGGLVAVVAAPLVVKATSLMPIRGRVLLTKDMTIYVNPNSYGEGEPIPYPHHAFRTIQKALDYVAEELDCNGHSVVVQLADGTYNENFALPPAASFGLTNASVRLTGNISAPERVCLAPLFDVRNNVLDLSFGTLIPKDTI